MFSLLKNSYGTEPIQSSIAEQVVDMRKAVIKSLILNEYLTFKEIK